MRLFKNHSRFLAMAMALVLCVGLCQPAFAWVNTCNGNHTPSYSGGGGMTTCSKCGTSFPCPGHVDQFCGDHGGYQDQQHGDGECDYCHFAFQSPQCPDYKPDETCKHQGYGEYSKQTVAPTCTEVGQVQYFCSNCDQPRHQDSVPSLGHNMVNATTVPATCTTSGLEGGKYCQREGCNYTEGGQTIPALSHNYSSWTDDNAGQDVKDGTHSKTCQNPATGCVEAERTVSEDHSYGEPDVTTNGGQVTETWTCTGCGHTYTKTTGCAHSTTTKTLAKPATCLNPATYKNVCDDCGKQIGETYTEGDALGHEYGDWTDDDATSGKDGTHSRVCTRSATRCDLATREESEDHAYTVEPTVVQVGDVITTTYTCGDCGHQYSVTTTCDHQAHNSVREIRPATCTEPAAYRNWCEDCQAFYGAEFTQGDALGHAYDIVRMVEGNAEAHLVICANDSAHNYMAAHTFGDWSDWVDNVRTRTCADCGYEEIGLRVVDVPGVDEPTVTPPVVTPPTGGDDDTDTPAAPVTPVAPVTPAPAEDEDIDDNDTPLAAAPTDAEPAEEPAAEPAEEPAGEEDIDDNETPLTNAPAAVEPVEEPAAAEEDVSDNDVPMADVPKTGDLSVVWYAATALSALGLTALGKKKEENDG